MLPCRIYPQWQNFLFNVPEVILCHVAQPVHILHHFVSVDPGLNLVILHVEVAIFSIQERQGTVISGPGHNSEWIASLNFV
jgi:hypothetical protein